MIRNLLATTAIATLLAAGGAMAQAPAPAPAPGPADTVTQVPMVIHADGHLASNIIGESVYNGVGDEAENIGNVTDLIVGENGEIEGIVVGVGGFLGLGRKDVAIEYDLAEWVERDNERWLVVETTREALEGLEDFDKTAYEPTAADREVRVVAPATAEQLGMAATPAAAAPAGDNMAAQDNAQAPAGESDPTQSTAEAPAQDGQDGMNTQDSAQAPAGEAAGTQDSAQAPADGSMDRQDSVQAPAGEAQPDRMQTGAIDRSTLQEAPIDQISADDFIGTTVYGAGEENVGSISDVIFTEDGQVEAAIVDVGGFLGMGTKPVALDLENLNFMSDGDGNLYLYTGFTQEQLEAQPEYDEAAYAERRDEILLRDSTVR